jgi:hypothetical protein
MTTGLDYSAGVIPGSVIKNAGHGFVIRYVDDPAYVATKHIHPSEYADLVTAGVDVWLVFEVGTNDIAGGFAAGVINAKRAQRGAAWVGYPANRPIFFACDEHLYGQNLIDLAMQYLDGAASVLGVELVGDYGFVEEVTAAQAGKHASLFWQCGESPAPGAGVHVWQRNDGAVYVGGIQCDVNELLLPMVWGSAAHAKTEDLMKHIHIEPVPNQPGVFRGATMVECATTPSQVIAQTWVRFGVTYANAPTPKTTKVVLTSLHKGSVLGIQQQYTLLNNDDDEYSPDPKATQVTLDVIGQPGALITADLITKPLPL